MNYNIYVIRPLEAGTSPFVFQAPSDLVAIKTLLASTVNLSNGQKLYDYDLELICSQYSLTPDGVITSPLLSRSKVLGTFSSYFANIAEYNLLQQQPTEVING